MPKPVGQDLSKPVYLDFWMSKKNWNRVTLAFKTFNIYPDTYKYIFKLTPKAEKKNILIVAGSLKHL